MSSDDENFDLAGVFTEPPRPPTPEPTVTTYTRDGSKVTSPNDWRRIDIRLVGSHPLWAHYLWNAALALASFLDSNVDLFKGRCVLELGAGGALPSIVAAKLGARKVVVTDYPDASLVQNMSYNVSKNTTKEETSRVAVQGYIWGHAVKPLLDDLPSNVDPKLFDVIILSDLIFNHSQHDAMLKTCELALAPSTAGNAEVPQVLVFYSHHRPHLADRDMKFFVKAKEHGWVCDEIYTKTFPPMFPNDSGEESIRSTVHGWRLTKLN